MSVGTRKKKKSMKYYVGLIITGRYTAEVEANSIEEAKELAKHKWENADFGELEDVGEFHKTPRQAVEIEG